MSDATIISDDSRCTITAQRGKDGGVALRGPFRSLLLLSRLEIQRIVEFARDEPELGKLVRFPVRAAEAAASDALNFIE